MVEFGERIKGVSYTERPCAYAIIGGEAGEAGTIALVRTRKGYFLPGGGIDSGETVEAALRREVIEELGYESEILERLGAAVQYLYDEEKNTYFRKVGYFFRARLARRLDDPVEPNHELFWFSPRDSVGKLTHEFQSWAVRRAFEIEK